MSKIVLSIILPLYQAGEHIKELFHCLNRQKFIQKDVIEILLWNDGSTDHTHRQIHTFLPLLSAYKKVTIISQQKNAGLFAVRLQSAQQASGEFLTFIDKQTRPLDDYIFQLLAQKWPLVVGNPVMDKYRSWWDKVLFLIRRKLYFPYFGYEFPDLTLTTEQYRRFKNKGGGGALLVRKSWFLEVAKSLHAGKNRNDDSLLIQKLTNFSPLRKTAKAKLLYLNRTGWRENIAHLFWRGPKFIDYYLWPWNRYSLFIFGGLIFLAFQPLLLLGLSSLFVIELALAGAGLIALSIWLSEEPSDFLPLLLLLPIIIASFALGCLLGVGIQLYAVIRK